MSLVLDKTVSKFFVGSNPEVTQVTDYATKEPQKDKETGKNIYTVAGELITSESVEAIKLKIIADSAPVLTARTEYGFDGTLVATPWLADGANRVSISYKFNGSLTTGKASFPAPKND